MMTATGKRRSELTVMNDQKRSEPARASIDACYHATRLASTSRGSLVSRRAADRHGNWAALLPLPAAPDPLVTGLAFLLLARLVLERSAQAGGLSLFLRHGCRLRVAPGSSPRAAWFSGLRCADRHGQPCVRAPSPPVDPESSATISIVPASTSFLSPGCSMSCEDICPLFRGPRCNVLPRGRGMLRGFPVLLVTAAMLGTYLLPFPGVCLGWP